MKRKANISIELYPSNVTIGLTLAITLTLNFQGQIFKLLSQEWEGQLTLNKRDVSLWSMTMTMTFWWPR